jgi:hypothetical protein
VLLSAQVMFCREVGLECFVVRSLRESFGNRGLQTAMYEAACRGHLVIAHEKRSSGQLPDSTVAGAERVPSLRWCVHERS